MAKNQSHTMASQNNKSGLHYILLDLQLGNPPSGDDARVSAIDVLQHLLETNVVAAKAVRAAYIAVKATKTVNKKQPSAHMVIEKKEAVIQPMQPPAEIVISKVEPVVVVEKKKETLSPPPPPPPPQPTYRRRHIALQFSYDGANYSGLAENVGFAADQSVEKVLFKALCKARLIESRETCGFSRCGRTDKGVSAVGQVVAMQLKSAFHADASWDEQATQPVDTKDLVANSRDTLTVWAPLRKKDPTVKSKAMTEYAYDKILNNLLPDDIRVIGWAPVSDDFSARFSATTRTYRYFFCPRQMNLLKMNTALQLMTGSHDFRNFCKMDVQKVYNFHRTIHEATIVQLNDTTSYLQIFGQAFLWHQIRCIASVLFLVGQGLEEPSVVSELLNVEKYPGKPSYALAPERPLVLHHCGYPNLEFDYSVPNMWHVYCHFEQQWEELALAAARVRNCQKRMSELSVDCEELTSFCLAKIKMRQRKGGGVVAGDAMNVDPPFNGNKRVVWGEAMPWIKERFNLVPAPFGARDTVYLPLMDRGKGTTYEEKVEATKKSSKRRQKYEDNVIAKRQTREVDQAFYAHMTKQGSSNL